MTQLNLHNTLTRQKEPFEPADPRRVTMYVCGPTVYSRAHIGNARPAVVFDVLFRLLRHIYGADHVVYARNITDIDDRINEEARETGKPISEITSVTTQHYHDDTGALGVLPPTIEPFATQHVSEMIAMMEKLIGDGFAYAAEGHVLFDVTSFEAYGKFSNRDRDDMIAGARVEVAPYKKNPGDFVLWKPSTDDLPGWDSPWGRGRPGWHIECSAMIEKHLGETIDLHGGGHDLIFPHHENEVAQSTCAHGGAPLARHWLHNGFLSVNADKMSKSLGNIVTVDQLLDAGHDGETIRFALLSAQYRQPLDWTQELLAQAKSTLDRLYRFKDHLINGHNITPKEIGQAVRAATPPQDFMDALADDLNTPKALAALSGMVDFESAEDPKALLGAFLISVDVLGLLRQDPETWLKGGAGDDDSEIDALVEARNAARANKDFAEADRIRDELAARGVTLEDGAGGTKWRRGT